VGANGRHTDKIAHDPVEAAVRGLAGRQSGNVTRRQLLSLGLGTGAIKARLSNGSLVTRYHGVYALAPARQDAQARIAAAVLAGGPGAVASHATAAFLWGFVPRYQPPPEITLTQGDRRPRHILTHRCRSLQPRDVTRQHAIPTTTRPRTALDLAPTLTKTQLTRLVNNARLDGHLRPDALHDILTRNPLHPGAKLLTPFLDSPGNPTKSEFEDAFLAFTTRYHLPTPLINTKVNGYEVDRERDAHHLMHGTPTVRLTRERLEHQSDREAARLQTILSLSTS
jgi:hypothetical protein